jgi:hypothetical protein
LERSTAEAEEMNSVSGTVVLQQKLIRKDDTRLQAYTGTRSQYTATDPDPFYVQRRDVVSVLKTDERVQALDVGVGRDCVVRAVEEHHQVSGLGW